MTWRQGAVATEPAGQHSTARTGIQIICDTCRLADVFISQKAMDRAGSVLAIQRVLYRRGWTYDHDNGRDTCKTCTAAQTAKEVTS